MKKNITLLWKLILGYRPCTHKEFDEYGICITRQYLWKGDDEWTYRHFDESAVGSRFWSSIFP